MHMYCEFENTNTKYNNKDIYVCKYCNIKLILENPDTDKVLCFAKQKELHKIANPEDDDIIENVKPEDLEAVAIKSAIDKMSISDSPKNITNEANNKSAENLCTTEEIDKRLAICNQCEYFKDNSCMLCGCVVVRESNFNNKLAHKNQSCPINKWSAIN